MDKLELYKKAKEAYYSGEPIMGDAEFDALEQELGLENNGYVGDVNSNYTVKHPVIMGSLSKIQIKESKDKTVDWNKYAEDILSYMNKANLEADSAKIVISPKFDGCSFEAVVKNNEIVSISSRGDGEKGKDLYKYLYDKVKRNCVLTEYTSVKEGKVNIDEYILRGEVVIAKYIFENRYSDKFANTRSFVAGILNRDYDENDEEFIKCVNDLDIIIYDVRVKRGDAYKEFDFYRFNYTNVFMDDLVRMKDVPTFYMYIDYADLNAKNLEDIYNVFDSYREQQCEWSLDGIVFKPDFRIRQNNTTRERPIDCVAVKFKPQMQETEIVDIIWKLGKTGEYAPVIVVNPIVMDNKSITKASAFNYGYMKDNKISIGTKVVLSLAGDIIPYIYEVTDTAKFNEERMNLCAIDKYYIDGVHLMADLDDEDVVANKLFNSIKTLGIKGLGESAAKKVVEHMKEVCMGDEFFGIPSKPLPDNVLLVTPEQINDAIGGKVGENVMKVYKEYLKYIKLEDIIKCCNFKLCGERVAKEIANKFIGTEYDFASMAKEAWEWAFVPESENYKKLQEILGAIGYDFDSFKKVELTKSIEDSKIPVILTGEPNDYKTKAEFIQLNPQYRVTSKWTEVEIVFTNDLNSNTGKMKKAREKGIEIRLY